MSPSNLYVGLDAGGSNTELLARAFAEEHVSSEHVPPGEHVSRGEGVSSTGEEIHLWGPGANPKRIGMDESAGVLADLVRRALRRCPEARLRSVCAGVAGADSEGRRGTLAASLRRALGEGAPGARVHLVHDARIALEAAFGSNSGVIVIAGTGSAVFARTEDGDLDRAGGWGYILGDEGSGYALGRAGLRAVARARDGGPPTLLQSLLAEEEYDMENRAAFIRSVYDAEPPLQDVAQTVLQAAEEGDAVAARILKEQTTALARQVAWLAGREAPIAPRVALFGGLVNDASYVETLRRAVHGHLPDWSVQPASNAPVAGALHLALPREQASSEAPARATGPEETAPPPLLS